MSFVGALRKRIGTSSVPNCSTSDARASPKATYDRVALGRDGQIDERVRERQFAFGTAEPVVGLPGLERHADGRADRRARCPRRAMRTMRRAR